MNIKNAIRNMMYHPLARGLDLDSSEATEVHAILIRKKAFLRKQYEWYYRQFVAAGQRSPDGLRMEIGSGGGFLSKQIPDLITVDLRPGVEVDLAASACALPIDSMSVGAIFMLNVLHHLSDVRSFFKEAVRVLRPDGRLMMIEPFVSPFSRWVYRYLHHEPFDPDQTDWSIEWTGSMSSANCALPWIVFVRDRRMFENEFQKLQIRNITPHTAFTYLLSGGVSMRSFLPGTAFEPLAAAEAAMGRALKWAAMMMTVEIVRLSDDNG